MVFMPDRVVKFKILGAIASGAAEMVEMGGFWVGGRVMFLVFPPPGFF
jgi:hypothetical protein